MEKLIERNYYLIETIAHAGEKAQKPYESHYFTAHSEHITQAVYFRFEYSELNRIQYNFTSQFDTFFHFSCYY